MLTACDRTGGISSASVSSQAQNDYDEQIKRQQAQLDAWDKQGKRGEELLVTQEQFMKRQLEAFEGRSGHGGIHAPFANGWRR